MTSIYKSSNEINFRFRTNAEPKDEEIKRGLHEKIYTIASDIACMPPDPLYPECTPKGVVVGSYPQRFDPDGKDVDFEVYGVSSEHLIQEIPNLECFQGRIKEVEIRGNAYKALSLILEDGSRIDFSVPILEPSIPLRYAQSSLVEAPEASFEEAARRRRFTFDSIGYDPLTDEKLDPFGGEADLKTKILKPLSPWFSSDPIVLPYTIRLLARDGWSSSEELEAALRQMVRYPGNRTDDNFRDYRYRWEISRWFVSEEPPSTILKVAERFGFLDVEAPSLNNLRKRFSVWGPVLELLDIVWQDSKERGDGEAETIGKQMGVLFAGIVEADCLVLCRLRDSQDYHDKENRPLGLVGLMMAFLPQAPEKDGMFELAIDVALETAKRVQIHHRTANLKPS